MDVGEVTLTSVNVASLCLQLHLAALSDLELPMQLLNYPRVFSRYGQEYLGKTYYSKSRIFVQDNEGCPTHARL
jgi:hypothetical protein